MIPSARFMPSPSAIAIADYGEYWTAKNPTIGTGLATIAALASLSDTSPFVQINSQAAGTGAKSTYVDYAKFTCRNIGTAGASVEFAAQTYAVAKAAPTGGTLLTNVNARALIGAASAVSSVWAGALVAAAGTPKPLTSQIIRPVAPVVGDMYFVKFGAPDYNVAAQVESGAAVFDDYVAAPPFIIDPGCTGQLHIWLPSQSGASQWEVEIGLYEF